MKNYIYGFLLSFMVLICPLSANDSNQKEPSLRVNQLIYQPIHAAQYLHDTLYISGEDLAAMTYGTYEISDDKECLTIQNNIIDYTDDSRYIQVNHISKTLSTPTCTINEITYIPITILDLISYPYTLSEDGAQLSLTPLMPYSTATDSPSGHRLFSTSYKNYEEVFSNLLDVPQMNTLLKDAKKNNYYISFMSTTYKKQCFEAMADLSNSLPYNKLETHVHLRQLNCSSHLPTLSGWTTLPVNFKMYSDGLSLTIGEQKQTNTSFWSTYNPSLDSVSIDLNKSLDTLVMRSLYAYYRDLYNLKDDLHTSPILTIQMGRSEQMRYLVYLDTASNPTEFQVIIYRMTTGKTVDYYIDVMTK